MAQDRETVIVDRGSSPVGIIVGMLVVALIVLALIWMFGGNFGGGGGTVDVDVPAVSVDVVPDGQWPNRSEPKPEYPRY